MGCDAAHHGLRVCQSECRRPSGQRRGGAGLLPPCARGADAADGAAGVGYDAVQSGPRVLRSERRRLSGQRRGGAGLLPPRARGADAGGGAAGLGDHTRPNG